MALSGSKKSQSPTTAVLSTHRNVVYSKANGRNDDRLRHTGRVVLAPNVVLAVSMSDSITHSSRMIVNRKDWQFVDGEVGPRSQQHEVVVV